MRFHSRLALPLTVLVFAGACAGAASSAVPSTPSAPVGVVPGDLDGRTFLSQTVSGHDLAPGSQVRLSFQGIHLGASAGCNQLSGEYDIVDGVLNLGRLATTEMACQDPLMAQDQWLGAFLPGSAASLDGDTLVLARAGVTLRLLDEEVANPDRPLEGTRWTVTGIRTGDAVSNFGPATATLTFHGGTLDVDASCNRGSAPYTLGDGTVTVGVVATTMKLCDGPTMQLEDGVLGVLRARTLTWAIDADHLTLGAGATGLELTAGS